MGHNEGKEFRQSDELERIPYILRVGDVIILCMVPLSPLYGFTHSDGEPSQTGVGEPKPFGKKCS